MRTAALVVVLAACFSKPDAPAVPIDASVDGACLGVAPRQPSQPSNPGIEFPAGSAPLATFLDGAQLGFANDLIAFPMPDRLVINNVNLIATPEGCNVEDQIGIAAYPAFSVAAASPLDGSSVHALERLIVGPAFTSVQVNWEFPFSCDTGPTVARGQTQWSLFPDGRVVRNDTINPSTTRDITPPGCQCSGANGVMQFLVTSYSAFETQHFSAVTLASATTDAITVPAPSVTPTRNQHGACLTTDSGGRVAVRWDVLGQEPATPPTRIRFVETPGMHREIVLVYDSLSASQLGASDSAGVRTHMFLDDDTDGNCVALSGRLAAYIQTAPLRIAGVDVPYSGSGVFQDDDRTFAGPVELEAAIGSIPPGFVVGLRMPGFSSIRTDPPVAGVVWQRGDNGLFHVYVPAGLTQGTSVTVTPEC